MFPNGFYEYAKLFRKFELVTRAQRQRFANDYEYVDFALSILQRSFSSALESFPNSLEEVVGNFVKSDVESETFRTLGNNCFKAGQYLEAHRLYTLSIACATSGSRQIALAYGNRSAVLFEKQYYKECLEDIKRAFENNYPVEKKVKLLQRQKKSKDLLPTQKKILNHDSIPKIKNINPNMPSAADNIKIVKNDEFGRHIVANRTINPGELLLVENSYVQCVFADIFTAYCSECLEVCYNLIPCDKCSGVLYCSRLCKRKAYVDYHRYECAVLLHFGFNMININAVRMTLKAVKEFGKELTEPNVYRSDRFKEFSELKFHKPTELDFKTLIQAAAAAKAFYALKKHTDIFSEFDIDDKENVLKTMLFNNALIEQTNAVSVTEHDISVYFKYGRAVYSTFSLFNHACNENVGHSFYGSTIVLRATRKIRKGQQCFVNYGVNPFIDTKMSRQKIIQGCFCFTCKCQACEQNWPKLEPHTPEAQLLMSEVATVYAEVSLTQNITKPRKNELLQKTFRLLDRLEPMAPYWTYGYVKRIFDKIMLEGNTYNPF